MGSVYSTLCKALRGPAGTALLAALLVVRARQRAAQAGFAAPPAATFLQKALGVAAAVAGALRRALPGWAQDLVGLYALWWMRKRAGRALDLVRAFFVAPRKALKDGLGGAGYRLAKRYVPAVRARVAKEHADMRADIGGKLRAGLPDDVRAQPALTRLPARGRGAAALLAGMRRLAGHEAGKWKTGGVSGGVYHGGDAHLALMNDVYAAFDVSNSLHPDVWPSVMKFEAEVIAMTADLMNGGFLSGGAPAPIARDVCGCMTSGGTESIVCATKAHREWARTERGIDPDDAVVVAPATAHAAIDKACELLRIRLVKVPVRGPSFRVDPAELARAVTGNTVMIYASAPQFPHGVVDPVAALGRVALDAGCGLHVDCCLGGFVLPFQLKLRQMLERGGGGGGGGGTSGDPRLVPALRDMLAGLEPFDFTVPGVTSMSVDTHKYGYASKGTSVVLYRDAALRRCQYFAYADWPGGLYVTPCLAGSTPGALRAACWASMVSLGESGYVGAVRSILECALAVRAAVEATPELVVLGEPRSMIVAFAAADPDAFNIYSIGDVMAKKGWSLNSLQHPACIHLCVTLCTVRNAGRFRGDLAAAIEEVRANGAALAKEGNAPIYGMAGSVPGGAIKEVLAAYVDTVLSNPDP